MKKKETDGLIFTKNLTKQERKKAQNELTEARKNAQASLTEQDLLAAKILQFKLTLKDYLKKDEFDPEMSFSSWLIRYVNMLDKKRRTFAEEIDIDETELSQVINEHRPPAEYLFIRLEIHSNNNIPASWWYKLILKEREHHISTDQGLRREQRRHVVRKLKVKI